MPTSEDFLEFVHTLRPCPLGEVWLTQIVADNPELDAMIEAIVAQPTYICGLLFDEVERWSWSVESTYIHWFLIRMSLISPFTTKGLLKAADEFVETRSKYESTRVGEVSDPNPIMAKVTRRCLKVAIARWVRVGGGG